MLGLILTTSAIGALASDARISRSSEELFSPRSVSIEANTSHQFMAWVPGDIQCGGSITPVPVVMRQPMGSVTRINATKDAAITLEFVLDRTGRPMSIKRAGAGAGAGAGAAIFPTTDLMPSLAASRFDGGGLPLNCSITYTQKSVPVADAPLPELLRRDGYSPTRSWPDAVRDRVALGNCKDSPRPRSLMRYSPDFDAVSEVIGARSWLALAYDIDTAGVPENIRIIATSGNDDLEREATQAVAKSRFRDGDRTGCSVSMGKGAAIIDAPEAPETEQFGESPDACDADERWAVRPRLNYPSGYETRAIDGWAIVKFDVAPWGQIGSVEVLEAQPSEEFGAAATAMIRMAKFKPQEQGLVGCIERVFYRMKRSPNDNNGETESGPQ